jgi:putative addiction module killer protein
VIEVRQTDQYARWFASLRDRTARARIDVRIRRLSLATPVTSGRWAKAFPSYESIMALDTGVYFVQRGNEHILLLAGGDKSSQDADIRTAKALARGL